MFSLIIFFIVLIMEKQILLISIILVSILAQDQILAVSGDGSNSATVEDGSRIIKDLPNVKGLVQSHITSFSLRVQQVQSAPANFNFLNENSLGNDAKWVSANSRNVLAINSLTTFIINYTTFCNSQVSFSISASNIFRVLHNGNVVQGWSFPWPQIYTMNLTPSCQCNAMIVQVFNCWYQSPAAIIYYLSQNTDACFKCGRQNQFWNYKNCSCDCKRTCCPKGQLLANKTCQCMKIVSGYGSLNINGGILGPN